MDEYINKLGAEAFYQNFMKLLAQEMEKHTGAVEFMVDKGIEAGLNIMIKAVRQLPPADVAPVVHGGWLEYGGEDEGFHFCSVCKGQAFNYEDGSEIVEVRSNYCPSCGALMDGRTTPAYRMGHRLKARFGHDT